MASEKDVVRLKHKDLLEMSKQYKDVDVKGTAVNVKISNLSN